MSLQSLLVDLQDGRPIDCERVFRVQAIEGALAAEKFANDAVLRDALFDDFAIRSLLSRDGSLPVPSFEELLSATVSTGS